jgi:hypothetical protein
MKNLTFLFVFSLIYSATYGQVQNKNPLKIDGFTLYQQSFCKASKGLLTFEIKNNPEKIPFKVYLKRGADIINVGASSDKRVVPQIELSEVLKYGKAGDYLIVEPADKTKKQYTKYLFLRNMIYDFFDMYKKGDGC